MSDFMEYSKTFAEPLMRGPVWSYPESVPSEIFGTIRPFKDGDKILYIGDSITHGNYGGHTYVQLMTYFATRYPGIHLVPINKGIDGNTVDLVNKRFGFDIGNPLDPDANVAVVLIGTNDMSRVEYIAGNELKPGTKERRQKRLTAFENGLRRLIENIKTYTKVERIILLSAPIYDEWMPVANKPASEGFNNVLRKAGQIAKGIAAEFDNVEFVDIHTPQILASQYRRRFFFDGFTVAADRVHPNAETHYVGVNTLLKAMGENGLVSSVCIDCETNGVLTENAEVTDLSVGNTSLSYTYLPKSLPLPCDEIYRKAQRLFPISEELNREILQIKGLPDGRYKVRMDGETLFVLTSDLLSEGYNISESRNNAGQKQSLALLGWMDEGRHRDASYRNFVKREAVLMNRYGLDATTVSSFEKSVQDKSAVMTETDLNEAKAISDLKKTEKETVEANRQFEAELFNLTRPVAHRIEIEKTSEPLSETHSVIYERFLLPEGTTNVSEISRGLTVVRAFAESDGKVLSGLPEKTGDVLVSFRMKNTAARAVSAKLYVYYEMDRIVSGRYSDSFQFNAGEEQTLSLSVFVPVGVSRLCAEVFVGDRTVAKGRLPICNPHAERVEVGSSVLSCWNPADPFTVAGIHLYDDCVPVVRAFCDNAFAPVCIKQAAKIGDCAEITVGGTTNRVSIVNRPIPDAVNILVGEKDLPGFDSEVYEYEVIGDVPQKVTCVWGELCKCSVWQATKDNPVATVKVRSVFGEEREYTIRFKK